MRSDGIGINGVGMCDICRYPPSTVIDMRFSRSPFTAENGNNVPQERAVIDSDALNCVG